MSMGVTYFRKRRDGPEAHLEDAVVGSRTSLVASRDLPYWIAGSLPIGAGFPDLALVGFRDEVARFSDVSAWSVNVVAYLRVVGRASVNTISDRMGRSITYIESLLGDLLDAEIVCRNDGIFGLAAPWRDILPEVVTVEAKVSHWRRAVAQAARNRLFSHRVFVALPESLAHKVRAEPIFLQLGVGIVSVSDVGEVRIMRRARSHVPRVWNYYYEVAFALADHHRSM